MAVIVINTLPIPERLASWLARVNEPLWLPRVVCTRYKSNARVYEIYLPNEWTITIDEGQIDDIITLDPRGFREFMHRRKDEA